MRIGIDHIGDWIQNPLIEPLLYRFATFKPKPSAIPLNTILFVQPEFLKEEAKPGGQNFFSEKFVSYLPERFVEEIQSMDYDF
ncbi:hypothetical protein AYI70_g6703 [Smittium culicis]|uniref:Uncharacterized protein n=1 Tax=Smittium culicis TaxID=133412 RepID=A0A1R1XNT7_9FUNG|nr:hypothetical protein AYI70_g6703 [Smittium culicis]